MRISPSDAQCSFREWLFIYLGFLGRQEVDGGL